MVMVVVGGVHRDIALRTEGTITGTTVTTIATGITTDTTGTMTVVLYMVAQADRRETYQTMVYDPRATITCITTSRALLQEIFNVRQECTGPRMLL